MCLPAAALAVAATAMSAVGTGMGALQANAQAKYQAKIAERNAGLAREAGLQERQNLETNRLSYYRRIADMKGQQRVAAAANGVSVEFGTAADLVADTDMLGREDVLRLYQDSNNRLRGRDIEASNYGAEADAMRQAGTGALIKGAFDFGSTVLGGASQYKTMRRDAARLY